MAKTAAKNTTKSTAPRAARKSNKPAAEAAVTMNHAEALESEGIDNLLADLLGDDSAAGAALEAGANDEVTLEADEQLPADDDSAAVTIDPIDPASVELSPEEIDHAVGHVEAVQASIDAATPTGIESDAAPTGDQSDAAPITPDDAVAAAPAPAKTPRKHYTDKLERIKDRLGAGAADYTVLTLADAAVSDEELQVVMQDTFDIIKGMNKKEQNRASLLFDFLSGKKATLSNVLETTLRVLHRDGHITTGKTSNLITELIAKPYSIASARAMGGNTVGMYRDLKLLNEDGKGRFIANPESTLLAAANAKLGLVAASA
jgi:hypothetical protein